MAVAKRWMYGTVLLGRHTDPPSELSPTPLPEGRWVVEGLELGVVGVLGDTGFYGWGQICVWWNAFLK